MVRGVIALAVVAVVIGLLYAQYRGAFRPVFEAVAVVDDIGDGIAPGADVKLRGARIGNVSGVRALPTGDGLVEVAKHEVDLELRSQYADGIPAGVTARVVPSNVFGAPAIELLDPSDTVGPRLAVGARIPGDRSLETIQLQTVITQLNKVLKAIHPAELNVALTNISQSLQGRGQRFGSIVDRAAPYLSTLNAHTPEFVTDLRLLGTDLDTLADSAPDLLDTVDNAVVTARTAVDKRDRLADVLTGGERTAKSVDEFLDHNSGHIIRATDNLSGILRTLAIAPDEIPEALRRLGEGARPLAVGFDPNGGKLVIKFSLTPWDPYTAADCPRYPGVLGGPAMSGRNCGRAGSGRVEQR